MKTVKTWSLLLASLCLTLLLTAGCGQTSPSPDVSEDAASWSAGSGGWSSALPEEDSGASSAETPLDPEGVYTSADDVSLYLYTYGELPGNFITKKEARALGWTGGSLEPYAPGMCIGGDYFGNYEGLLPEAADREYHECDIDTLGADSRGAKRIVYSDDGIIYYTEDHYETFTLLYWKEP